MTNPQTPPVFVLGCHRSGTSLVTGLLAEAGGLYLGDVLPPDPANPRGYFESSAAVLIHNRLLAAMDRDWTCPPSSFDPGDFDLHPVRVLASRLSAGSGLWGLKDPRTLFLLPAWTSTLGRIRLVGVTRDSSEITKSIIRRDGIPPEAAAAVAEAYLERLAAIEEEFGIPIIDFSSDPTEVIDRTREVAAALDLKWNRRAANSFYSSGLVHHVGTYPTATPASQALRAAALKPVGSIEAIPADRLEKFVNQLDISPRLRTDVGPRHNQRRAQLLHRLSASSSDGLLELTPTIEPASSMKVGTNGLTSLQVAGIEEMTVALSNNPGARSLSFASLVDDLDDVELHRLLSLAATFSAPAATAVLDFRSPPTGEAVHPTAAFPRDPSQVEEVARTEGWEVRSFDDVGFDRWIAVLSKRLPDDPLNRHLIALRSTLTKELAEIRQSIADQAETLERRAAASTGEDATELEKELAETRRQLHRLRSRRSVRLATRFAAFTRPLFRRVRSIRK